MSLQYCLKWLLVVLHLLRAVVGPAAAKVPAIIVFGDSSVDTGNNNHLPTVARSNYQPYGRDFKGGTPTGRFSNGRLATDFISEAFGLPPTVPAYLDPSYGIEDFASGVCFASAATGYDNATAAVLSVIPLWQEVEYFKEYQDRLKSYQGEAKAKETVSEALYIMSMGTNDFLENYFSSNRGSRSSEYTVEQYETYLAGIAEDFINEIYQLGARKIDITGIPPMGCLPLERTMNLLSGSGDSCNDEYNKVAADFNSKLQDLVQKFSQNLTDLQIVYGNVYDLFVDVVQDPSLYGFENVAAGCCGSTGLFEMGYMCNSLLSCTDANKYVFWDAIHPTEKMNNIIANRIMNDTLAIFL